MRVYVDADRCEGNAICMDHCPEVFYVEDDHTLTILMPEVPERLREKLERVVERCPCRSLRIED